jgi:hypothetical protein
MGGETKIRSAAPHDLRGIVRLVHSCQPFITPYIPYYYWFTLRYFHSTCAVVELNGDIVG